MLAKTISHINAESKLKIAHGFAVSSKTGAGIEDLKVGLAGMVPTKAVPSSYEKLLKQIRLQSARAESPFLMAEDAQLLGLSRKVCLWMHIERHTHIRTHTYTHVTLLADRVVIREVERVM